MLDGSGPDESAIWEDLRPNLLLGSARWGVTLGRKGLAKIRGVWALRATSKGKLLLKYSLKSTQGFKA